MNDTRQLDMERRELLVIDDPRGHLITCESGELWLTQDGDRRDIILPAGHAWLVDRPGPLVLSALTASRATLAQTIPGRPLGRQRREGAAELLTRFRRWRFQPLAGFPAILLR
jgi:hypothetical protein